MQAEFEFCEDLPVRSPRSEVLFFCLFPDAAASRHVSEFAERFIRENRLTGNRIKTERLHFSLRLVGKCDRPRTMFTYAAQRAGDAMRSFEVTFPSIMSFEIETQCCVAAGSACPRKWSVGDSGDARCFYKEAWAEGCENVSAAYDVALRIKASSVPGH